MTGESHPNLFGRRSLLFLPASNPRAIVKARESGAELVVLDLEDAVKPEDKESARAAAVEAVAESWPMPVGIRVNGTSSIWHDADVAAVASSRADFSILPRVSGADEFRRAKEAAGKPMLAMIETARGVLAAEQVAGVADALVAGTNDLSADLRVPRGEGREPLMMALQHILLCARAAGVPAFDGVFNLLDDVEGLAAEAAQGRRLGFDGKSLIHPRQIGPCHAAFAPTDDEIARAERLVAAASGGAERFEGEMVERMHVEAAERLLRSAGRR
jgi:citrate lyase subunit beta/citryl-CoA lyase